MRLTARRLNRATLARQLLLERSELEPVAATEALGGLQAQEPASPYIALWTRLAGFEPDQLSLALHARDLVKATLGRSTLHIVSAVDYRGSVTALLQVTRSRWMQEQRGRPVERTLPELTEASLAFASEPRTNVELRDHAGTLGEPIPTSALELMAETISTKLDTAAAADDSTTSYVARREEMSDETRLPSGDELIGEIERFLRDQDTGDGDLPR